MNLNLGINNKATNDTDGLLIESLQNMTSASPENTAASFSSTPSLGVVVVEGKCAIDVDLTGHPLLVKEVSMTVFTAFLQAAQHPKTQIVRFFTVSNAFNIMLQIEDP